MNFSTSVSPPGVDCGGGGRTERKQPRLGKPPLHVRRGGWGVLARAFGKVASCAGKVLGFRQAKSTPPKLASSRLRPCWRGRWLGGNGGLMVLDRLRLVVHRWDRWSPGI